MPFLQRIEETFPEDPSMAGTVRCTIAGITPAKWAWLEPVLRALLAVSANSTTPARRATDVRSTS